MRIHHAIARLSLVAAAVASSSKDSQGSSYPLLHRFIPHPSCSSVTPDWTPYGTISLNHEGAGPAGEFDAIALRDAGTVDNGLGWYQVGLKVGDEILTTSTRSCYTSAPQVYDFILHLTSPNPDAIPTSMSLGVSAPLNGSCPQWFEPGDRLLLPGGIATKVTVTVPQRIQSVPLQPPPSVDPTTGAPAVPEVEKSFIQKYWLPILGVTLFMASQLGPEQPQQGGGGGGSGGAAAAR